MFILATFMVIRSRVSATLEAVGFRIERTSDQKLPFLVVAKCIVAIADQLYRIAFCSS